MVNFRNELNMPTNRFFSSCRYAQFSEVYENRHDERGRAQRWQFRETQEKKKCECVIANNSGLNRKEINVTRITKYTWPNVLKHYSGIHIFAALFNHTKTQTNYIVASERCGAIFDPYIRMCVCVLQKNAINVNRMCFFFLSLSLYSLRLVYLSHRINLFRNLKVREHLIPCIITILFAVIAFFFQYQF